MTLAFSTNGEDPVAAAFLTEAPPAQLHVAWVLSIGLGIDIGDLVALVSELWDAEAAAGAVHELLRWPFVDDLDSERLRLEDTVAHHLREDFRRKDAARFRRAHELLSKLETRNELLDDPESSWFTRGRVAYYLAGFSQDESMERFGESFQEPPTMSRTAARLWLSWLVERQSGLLDRHGREIAFFTGFRLYMSGRQMHDQALERFEFVLDAGRDVEPDRYTALASHFAGVLYRRSKRSGAIGLLEESVGLSERLGITENEIMARQSLSIALIERAAEDDLFVADGLARSNYQLALEVGDPSLIAWTSHLAADAHWQWLTSKRRDVDTAARQQAPAVIEALRQSYRVREPVDPETAVIAANECAEVLRDIGDLAGAMSEIAWLFRSPIVQQVPAEALGRIEKTARSIERRLEPSARDELHEIQQDVARRRLLAEARGSWAFR